MYKFYFFIFFHGSGLAVDPDVILLDPNAPIRPIYKSSGKQNIVDKILF